MTSGENLRIEAQLDLYANRPNIGVLEESNQFSSPGMQTPHLDTLAQSSMVLTNAYTQVTIACVSSIK